jgi:hypothetical protein
MVAVSTAVAGSGTAVFSSTFGLAEQAVKMKKHNKITDKFLFIFPLELLSKERAGT